MASLRAFEAVARFESFKLAAEEMAVTPGALSQQVRKLEEDLDVQLLVRENRNVSLTDKGRMLSNQLSSAFSMLRDGVDAVLAPDTSTELVVATIPSFSAKWLSPRIGGFLRRYPEIDVRIDARVLFADYQPGDFDVAIAVQNEPPAGYGSEKLIGESVLPLASPEYLRQHNVASPEDLLQCQLLSDESLAAIDSNTPTWRSWFAEVSLPFEQTNPAIKFNYHAGHALDAAVSGQGVVLGRKVLAHPDVATERLVCPFGPELALSRSYYLLWNEEKADSVAVSAFCAWMQSEMQTINYGVELETIQAA